MLCHFFCQLNRIPNMFVTETDEVLVKKQL